jgi:hypothetical protein
VRSADKQALPGARRLWGSRYHADYPSVPIDKIVANFNMGMVGRNRDDKAEGWNTVISWETFSHPNV